MQPPALWQRDAEAPAPGGAPGGAGGGVYESDDRIADSWRHVKGVAREGAKDYDLLDLLQCTRREETYSFPIPGVGRLCVGGGARSGAAGGPLWRGPRSRVRRLPRQEVKGGAGPADHPARP
jgi:hypothetical protein